MGTEMEWALRYLTIAEGKRVRGSGVRWGRTPVGSERDAALLAVEFHADLELIDGAVDFF